MASRTPKETLKAVRQARKSRKNRVEVVKQPAPKKPLILCAVQRDKPEYQPGGR